MFCPRHASLEYYMSLAEKYSQRHVNEQHPEDIFHAFSSVQSILKASYPGAFIQGIPECLLVQCLLWSTGATSHKEFLDPVTGRKASSWSWIGWSARIYYPGLANRYFPECADRYQSLGRREGLVSWYVSLKKDSRRYPVSVAKEEVWASHRKVEGLSSASILPLNASLTGEQDMALESQGFQHIIPLSADSHEPSTLEVKNLCSFLHGRVLMARFWVHFKGTGVTEGERSVGVLLCETSGNHAGVLCGRSDLLEDGQVINLIAISGGPIEAYRCCKFHFYLSGLLPVEVVDPPTPQSCAQRSPLKSNKQVYEFYDALWVEYEDGVAYRKGIGRVRKGVWDRETLGWVDVTLG